MADTDDKIHALREAMAGATVASAPASEAELQTIAQHVGDESAAQQMREANMALQKVMEAAQSLGISVPSSGALLSVDDVKRFELQIQEKVDEETKKRSEEELKTLQAAALGGVTAMLALSDPLAAATAAQLSNPNGSISESLSTPYVSAAQLLEQGPLQAIPQLAAVQTLATGAELSQMDVMRAPAALSATISPEEALRPPHAALAGVNPDILKLALAANTIRDHSRSHAEQGGAAYFTAVNPGNSQTLAGSMESPTIGRP